jgi:hypothetical protein
MLLASSVAFVAASPIWWIRLSVSRVSDVFRVSGALAIIFLLLFVRACSATPAPTDLLVAALLGQLGRLVIRYDGCDQAHSAIGNSTFSRSGQRLPSMARA